MNTDLIMMIGNLSQSLISVQLLITGFAYLAGIAFIMTGLFKLKKQAETQAAESLFAPVSYLVVGAICVFLPTALGALSNTVFGVGNVLEYQPYKPYNIVSSIGVIIKTVGLIFFLRGCFLVLEPKHENSKSPFKGLFYLFAGILAINFDNTIYYLNWVMEKVAQFTLGSPS